MKNFKAIIMAGLFAAGSGIAPIANVAHAATQGQPADCSISVSDVDAIKAIQNDPSLSANEEIEKELAARIALVTETINCAKSEVQALGAAIKAAPTAGDTQVLQSQFLDKLNDASNFYDIELGKLNGAGISGTQAVAKEVLAWRQGTYAPLEAEANNFILWSQNQVLFRTAQSRMAQTQRAVSFIESASGNADLSSAFSGATTAFQSAQDQNNAAEAALAQFSSPDQSLTLIQQSLQSLSDTYQKLFNVSTLISTLLPQ